MPVLVYSVLRILLIIIAGAGLYLAGMRGLLLVVGAVLIGAALSYLVLDRYRRASAQWLQARGTGHTKAEDRLEADAEAEDALLDEQEEQQHHDAETGGAAPPLSTDGETPDAAADVPRTSTPAEGQGRSGDQRDGKSEPEE